MTRAVSGVGARLGRAFLLQGAFIGIAAIVSVFLANVMLEGVLIRQALRDEASFYWSHRGADPAHPLPATLNLTGYIGDAPREIAALAPGFHDWNDGSRHNVVYVTERAGERLVLVFDRSGVGRLVVLFGLLPLALVLLVLYLSTWLAFRASRRAFSPVVALARQVRGLDPSAPEPGRFDRSSLPPTDDEVQELADALVRYSERLAEFIAREREFTRDASHELRSPLTVIHISAELLLDDERLSDAGRRAAERIRRAANDMDELTSAFLLLARESEAGLPTSALCVNEVVAAELERARVLAEDKPVESRFHASHRLHLDAPERVLAVLVGNLLRNAFSYTDRGEVEVSIDAEGVVISDTGVGIAPERLAEIYRPFARGEPARRGGFGVGLSIVRRLSDRFGWPVSIDSQPGVGTRIEVRFPGARSEPVAQGGQ
ncbi:MAG TPA: HAMP domain-containing sensor histidine kinase [Steroidobacteraceae bacterium]|nr:HAMP domain-containing sensor histidine kinase [Steroidobacteraceae bacterium]